MKKILPIIIGLIVVSLLGLIILQVSWFNDLVELRGKQIYAKINDNVTEVSYEIMNSLYNSETPRRMQGLKIKPDKFNPLRPISIEDKYSQKDIYQMLAAKFTSQDFKNVKFEFAVVNAQDEYEMNTTNFVTSFFDTIHNIKCIRAIYQSSSISDFDGLSKAEHLIVILPNFKQQVWATLVWVLAGSILFMIVIISAFYITLRTLLNQKKLSEIKSDFINNMTHEFKTPLATISLAIDSIKNPKVYTNVEKVLYFSNIIKEENKRMNKQVEIILQAALMEKKEMQFNNSLVNTHFIISSILDNYQLQIQEKNGKFCIDLSATNFEITADEHHFSNIISNLIDNAIKYSKENHPLLINISTKSNNNLLIISIEDNGIGMTHETKKRVFEKFYRAHTGNVHNVKGFGLGMSYVKSIIDAIDGTIKVESSLGKGSTFIIQIPLFNK
jgi:two-component system, OmpR family, phosphate regulon sensor histidine kinase PhoR